MATFKWQKEKLLIKNEEDIKITLGTHKAIVNFDLGLEGQPNYKKTKCQDIKIGT